MSNVYKRGRGQRRPVFFVACTEEELAAIDRLAAREGTHRSNVGRRAINQLLEEEGIETVRLVEQDMTPRVRTQPAPPSA